MADSLQVLKGKYEMALSSIRELEQERDIANHKISKMQEERAKQDKSTKYLCETILKKEKEKEEYDPVMIPKYEATTVRICVDEDEDEEGNTEHDYANITV